MEDTKIFFYKFSFNLEIGSNIIIKIVIVFAILHKYLWISVLHELFIIVIIMAQQRAYF